MSALLTFEMRIRSCVQKLILDRFTVPMVTVRVGAAVGEVTTFLVHENILKEKSDFFRIALDKKWQEGQLRKIDLPEDEPRIVGAFVHWLYEHDIAVTPAHEMMSNPDRDEQFEFISHLYVFGEKMQSDGFRDAAVSAMTMAIAGRSSAADVIYTPDDTAIKIIYDGSMAGSLARKLMVHILVAGGSSRWLGTDAALHHPEFLLDVARELLDQRTVVGLDSLHDLHARRNEWLINDCTDEDLW
jgi:hypothetical protein